MPAVVRAPGAQPSSPETLAVICYGGSWRTVVAALVVASRLGIPLIVARIMLGGDPELTLPLLAMLVTTLVLLPAGLASLLQRTLAAELTVLGDVAVITRRDLRVEVPKNAIVAVHPWPIPLPTPGASLLLRSGRHFPYGLGLADPGRLVGFLADHAGAGAATDRDDPALLHAAAAGRSGPFRWWHWLLKFPLFGLLPTAILFRAHQYIAYGGTFGEYYSYGARAYLLDFLGHWTAVTIHLGLYAGLLRVAAELLVWTASRLAPGATVAVRRVAELGCRIGYYGGVPLLLAARFLS